MDKQFLLVEKKYEDIVKQDKYRLKYHLMPYVGWLNDPNGLCQFHGIYHIFYQYSPQDELGSNRGCAKGWGHYTTTDFINFIKEDNPLLPDSEIDKNGAYSGSAFIKDDMIHFYYTGNIKFIGDYDYINEGRGHYVNYFSSQDGLRFQDKECLLKNSDYPNEMSCHVRDPKIYEEDGIYYMVLGSRTKESQGGLLIYQSDDLKKWRYFNRITTDYDFGYMWECPDLFQLKGKKILIICPQGVEKAGFRYENIYQNGYFFLSGKMNETQTFSEFYELDKGFDFYAPQTFEDEKQRRILIGWMGLPDIPYTNPTTKYHWQHALTLPRELTLKNNRIYQYPIEETKQLRKSKHTVHLMAQMDYRYSSHVCELNIKPLSREFHIYLRKDLELLYQNNLFTLKMGASGYGRDERHLEISKIEKIDIFSDTSSLEIFINSGEAVMTTRVYDDESDTKLKASCALDIDIYELDSYKITKRND